MYFTAPRKALAFWVTFLSFAAPLFAAPSTSGDRYPGQVAEIEVEWTGLERFTLRATVPVPQGTYFDGDTKVPLQVRNWNGAWVPTQVDIVSRYADATAHGADVLEVLARVEAPPSATPGDRLQYGVYRREHAPIRFSGERIARRLLGRQQGITILARDVFGHEYKADLMRDLREMNGRAWRTATGPLVQGWGTHSIMRPKEQVDGSQGTLPHFMGIHAFVKHWAEEEFITLDLRIHNGMAGRKDETNLDDPVNDLYFDELVIRVPAGWRVEHAYDDPFIGEDYAEGNWTRHPLIHRNADGSMHVLRHQGQLFRRLVLVPQGPMIQRARRYARHENLGFVRKGEDENGRPLWSWFEQETARFMPQRQPLPSLDHINLQPVRNDLRDRFVDFRQHVALGTGDDGLYPLVVEGQGYARPYGTLYGGMTGGVDIDLSAGLSAAAAASVDAYRTHEIIARMYIDRQPTCLYDLSGQPTRMDDWLKRNNQDELYFPGLFNLRAILPAHDPFGFNDMPTFQVDYVRDNRLQPEYEEVLLGFDAIDIQHWTRYTSNMKALAWLGNDALAKSEIKMAAEIYRMGHHQYPNNASGNLIASWGLLGQKNHVDTHPGEGLGFGRASGWGLDTASAAYALHDRELRDRFYPWFEMTLDVVERGQSDCAGYLQAQPHHSNNAQFRQRQTFETNIGENALKAMAETVFRGRDNSAADRVDQVIVRQVYGTISSAFWGEDQHAPYSTVAVGPWDTALPPFCMDADDVWASDALDTKYPWNSLGYAYQATGDIVFLTRAAQMAGTNNLFAHFQNNPTADIDNRGLFLGFLQSLEE